jgi:hypothetical protein
MYVLKVEYKITWTGLAATSGPPTAPPKTRPSEPRREILSPPSRFREEPFSVGT